MCAARTTTTTLPSSSFLPFCAQAKNNKNNNNQNKKKSEQRVLIATASASVPFSRPSTTTIITTTTKTTTFFLRPVRPPKLCFLSWWWRRRVLLLLFLLQIAQTGVIIALPSWATRVTPRTAAALTGGAPLFLSHNINDQQQQLLEHAKAFAQCAANAVELDSENTHVVTTTSTTTSTSTNNNDDKDGDDDTCSFLFTTIRSTRDIDQGKRRRFLYHFTQQQQQQQSSSTFMLPPVELHDSILARLPSPSGRRVAIFREEDKKGGGSTSTSSGGGGGGAGGAGGAAVTAGSAAAGTAAGGTTTKRAPPTVLEIWQDHALLRRIPLPRHLHGKLIFDKVTFGGASWSPDESMIVYLAERLPPDTVSYFHDQYDVLMQMQQQQQQQQQQTNHHDHDDDNNNNDPPALVDDNPPTNDNTNNTDDEDEDSEEDPLTTTTPPPPRPPAARGKQHQLGWGPTETWGESYGRQAPLLDVWMLSTKTGRVGRVDNCPGTESGTLKGGFSLGQVVFTPDNASVVYTAWDAGGGKDMPRRLGLIHCQQRPCKLYTSPIRKLREWLHRERKATTTTTTTTTTAAVDAATTTTTSNADAATKATTTTTTTTTTSPTTELSSSLPQHREPDDPCVCLTLEYRLACSPRFAPPTLHEDTQQTVSKLVFLSSKKGYDTHSFCWGLDSMDWVHHQDPTTTTKPASHQVVVPPVWNPNDDNDNDNHNDDAKRSQRKRTSATVFGVKFPGLFLNRLAPHTFLSPTTMITSTQWGSCTKLVTVSLTDGTVRLVQKPNSNKDKTKNDDCTSDTLLFASPQHGAVVLTSAPNQTPHVWHVKTQQLLEESSSDNTLVVALSSLHRFPKLGPIASSKFSAVEPTNVHLDFDCSMELVDQLPPPKRSSSTSSSRTSKTRTTDDDDEGEDESLKIPLQTILLTPRHTNSKTNHPPPLIVIPHGGPHAVSTAAYVPSLAFLCGYGGFAVALVNYRGSTGFGQAWVEALPGKIGDLDVRDMLAATLHLQTKLGTTRMGICGGSHGGFLTAHMTGQYPSLFRAACLRNPVVNLPAMVSTSDIPDWVYVETGAIMEAAAAAASSAASSTSAAASSVPPASPVSPQRYDWETYRPPTGLELQIMYDKSPIRYIGDVKAPTLVALGLQDLRVPPSQGLEWFYSLRATRRMPCELLQYSDQEHSLSGPACEADHWIHILRWFQEHVAASSL